jgi:hypothetical protein
MAVMLDRWTSLALAASVMSAAPAARAVELDLFADPGRACAYLATAGAADVAMVEIWLTTLQRDLAGGESRERATISADDFPRLDGEARTIETAITVIDAQIAQGHALLRALRGRVRAIDTLPESEAAARRGERKALQAEMRATSEELIEMSFDLRDARARLATVRTAMAGRLDSSAMVGAAQSTARLFGKTIRDCAIARRASLADAAALPSESCAAPLP